MRCRRSIPARLRKPSSPPGGPVTSDARPYRRRDRSGCRFLSEPGGFNGEMRLVLKTRVLALDQQRRGVRDRAADGFNPAHLRLREIAKNEIVNQRLVAGMADPEANPLVVVADMGGDRAQAIMAGVAAADLDPDLGRGEVEFVVNHNERARVELVEAQSLADAAAGIVHIGLRGEQ